MTYDKNRAYQVIEDKAGLVCEVSDKIWDNPETAFTEFVSAEILCQALENQGFEVTRGVAGIATAFTGRFGKGKPVIGILGEFDALSGLSQVAGATKKEVLVADAPGHGCGHNLLGAGSLAAAIAVKDYLETTGREGTVIYFGCPGEEGGSGKAFMAREGIFDQVDAAVSWHPSSDNSTWTVSSLANYQVSYRFYGTSAHAAGSPHLGRSALDAVEIMNVGVQFLREHVIQEARIHYAITNTGGFSPNVVQPFAEVLYLIRAPKTPQVQHIYERVNKIAEGAAHMTETRLEIDFVKACSNVVPNKVLNKVMQKNLEDAPKMVFTDEEYAYAKVIAGGIENRASIDGLLAQYSREEDQQFLMNNKDKILHDEISPLCDIEICMAGSSDVGDVSWCCPTVQCMTASEISGTSAHSWQYVANGKSSIAHKGMLFAAKAMAGTVIDLFESPETLEAAKAELNKRLGGGKYVCPIPADVKPRAIAPKK